jgi:ATP-binding protein involved in chromosome partitioning
MRSYSQIAGDGGSGVAEQIAELEGNIARRMAGIRHVVAVGSGKGGVGKSTLTRQLAAVLAAEGRRVGILDADLNGPSQALLGGVRDIPPLPGDDGLLLPRTRDGVRILSVGSLLGEGEALSWPDTAAGHSHVWRATREFSKLAELLAAVHWGELDVLLVDMPPGTGDVSISLGQLLPRAEAVIVTTPQPLAQEVAARAAIMAQKTNMRLIGVVENMTSEVFGTGGGERLAEQIGVPLLGRVPLDPRLRECGDEGESLVLADPESETVQVIVQIADAIHAGRQTFKPLPVLS